MPGHCRCHCCCLSAASTSASAAASSYLGESLCHLSLSFSLSFSISPPRLGWPFARSRTLRSSSCDLPIFPPPSSSSLFRQLDPSTFRISFSGSCVCPGRRLPADALASRELSSASFLQRYLPGEDHRVAQRGGSDRVRERERRKMTTAISTDSY